MDFYDKTEYDKYLDAIKKMNDSNDHLHKAFTPYRWFMDIKLYECEPCKFCDNMNHSQRGTSIENEIIDNEKCKSCMEHMWWEHYCSSKLAYFESNQNRI